MPNGYVIWQGNSLLSQTPAPIAVIITNTQRPSMNPKTGWMVQTWILRTDQHPMDAVKTGADQAVCGSCSLRGDRGVGRTCYVNLMTLGQVFKAYKEGKYPFSDQVKLVSHKGLRLGAYGEPTAVPFKFWLPWINQASMWTGYTSAWSYCDPRYSTILMASVKSETEQRLAQELGWRTYRVKAPTSLVLPGEIVCPGSAEAGKTATCLQCGLCNGVSRSANIVIDVHGSKKANFHDHLTTNHPRILQPAAAPVGRVREAQATKPRAAAPRKRAAETVS